MMKSFSLESFGAGLVLGILVMLFFGASSFSVPAFMLPPQSSSQSATSSAPVPDSEAVKVSDQKAGSDVVIDSLTIPAPGVWVAVREMNGNDLGNVLGAVRVAEPRAMISVPLLRATEPNRSYAIELYRDDNAGLFDPGLNSVYVDFSTGSRVVAPFKTKE